MFRCSAHLQPQHKAQIFDVFDIKPNLPFSVLQGKCKLQLVHVMSHVISCRHMYLIGHGNGNELRKERQRS